MSESIDTPSAGIWKHRSLSWLNVETAGGEPVELVTGPSTIDYICTSWQDDDPAYRWVVLTDAAGNEIERRRVLVDDDE